MIPSEAQLGTVSERPLSHERLQTEYSFEDSQSSDTSVGSISAQIALWRETACAFLCSLVLLFVHFAANSPICTLALPFLALDARRLYLTLISQPAITARAKACLRSAVAGVLHLAFLMLLVAFLEWRCVPLLAAGAPQYLSLAVAMTCERFRKNECQTFSKAVSATQFRIFLLWVEVGTIVFIGLKVDGVVDISWSTALWPCWAAESLFCLLTLGAMMLLLYAFCSYRLRRCDGVTVLCSLWFFWVLLSASLSFALCLYAAAKYAEEQNVTTAMKVWLALPILLLVSGLVGLHIMETRITWWCFSFFFVEFERPRSSQENLTSIAPLSERKLDTRSTSPGMLLYRVSSTFYKPANPTPEKKRPLTQVLPIALSEAPSTEEKITSVSMLQLDPPPAPRKVCMVCCQEFSNAVVMDCGHSGICAECAKEIWRHTGICHLCRERIVKVLEVEAADDSPFVRVISETLEAEGADTS